MIHSYSFQPLRPDQHQTSSGHLLDVRHLSSLNFHHGVRSRINRNTNINLTEMHNYTHYWKIHGWITSQDQPTWARLISDTRLVIEAAHVRLCGNYPVENGNGDDLDPPLVSDKCIAINSIDDDGHEMFELTIDDTRFDCRKTARKPYDVVVCCILLRVHVLAPQCIEVS